MRDKLISIVFCAIIMAMFVFLIGYVLRLDFHLAVALSGIAAIAGVAGGAYACSTQCMEQPERSAITRSGIQESRRPSGRGNR